MEKYCVIDSPLGHLKITADEEGICAIGFTEEELWDSDDAYLKDAEKQLAEYFAGIRKTFRLPLVLRGTPFQKKVWQALCEIPCGQTRSYGEIAAAVGNAKAARAVGMANHANPLVIVVPCHRVIGRDGSLSGYRGGPDRKRYLLALEKESGGTDQWQKEK